MARFALERMPAPEAAQALRDAAAKVNNELKVGVIGSLGSRRDAAAIPVLKGLLTDSDPSVARAAALALGAIGGVDAASVLKEAASSEAGNKPAVMDALLACAEALLAGQKTDRRAGDLQVVGGRQPSPAGALGRDSRHSGLHQPSKAKCPSETDHETFCGDHVMLRRTGFRVVGAGIVIAGLVGDVDRCRDAQRIPATCRQADRRQRSGVSSGRARPGAIVLPVAPRARSCLPAGCPSLTPRARRRWLALWPIGAILPLARRWSRFCIPAPMKTCVPLRSLPLANWESRPICRR